MGDMTDRPTMAAAASICLPVCLKLGPTPAHPCPPPPVLTHKKLERNPPLVDVRRQRRAEGGHEAHVLSREDESNVGAEPEQGVVLLRLLRRRDLRVATAMGTT